LGLALYADKIILAGKTRNAENLLDFAVARYINDTEYNVSVPKNIEETTLTVTPNPIGKQEVLTIQCELKQLSNITIELVNMMGKTVLSLPMQNQPSGKCSFQTCLPTILDSGIYFLKLTTNNNTLATKKVILL
jgi:hypothetical protein